uniref:Cytochrome P450 n=1 Tax=Panagrolaimus sp. ES5 TaxID=591445 RepID=A0AC34F9A3_9BILA
MWQILVFIAILWIFQNFYWKRRKFPPGPPPLPLIGNLLSLKGNNGEKAMYEWKKKYGDFFTVWFGENPVVLIGDAPTMYETFVKEGEAYAGRPKMSHSFNGEPNLGIGGIDGPLWREQRRFALQILRNFGLGRNLMQERVLHEVVEMIDHVKAEIKSGNEKVDMMAILDICVGSIINSLTFGYSFDKKNTESFYKLKVLAGQVIENFLDPLWKICLWNPNVMKYIPPFNKVYKRVEKTETSLNEIFNEKIKNHRKKIDFEADEEPRDFAEAFLRHQYKLNKDGVKDHNYSDKQLVDSALSLWIAGQETTSSTLAWLVLFMMEHQDIQKKAQEELDKHVGSDRLVTLDDKINLNYINAIVAETLRFSNLSSVNVFHRTMKEVKIHGYTFPENTMITYQIPFVLNDSRYFSDEKSFKPERFLDKDGKFFWPQELMVFGLGKRACLGEGLAKLELYLFAANILNQFKLNHPKDKKAELTRIIDLVTHPIPYKTFVENRY